MSVSVFVELAGTPVFAGTLYGHTHGTSASVTFVYDPTYLAHSRAYPLDPRLPLLSGPHQTDAGMALFGAMSDSAPDRWGRRLMQRYARTASDHPGARTLTDVELLLGVRDDLRQGALRYAAERDGPKLAEDSAPVPPATDLAHLLDLAQRCQSDELTEQELRLLLDSGSSLGGARPKVHTRSASGELAIAKFPSDDTDTWNVSAWEYVTASLARDAGMRVTAVELLRIAGRSVLLTPRFDRDAEGRRIGYWSAMTALEAADGDRGSYIDIAGFIETNALTPTDDLRELFTRVVFDMAVSNTDNHLRNHGFLRQGAGWTMSPAFDVNPNPASGRFATGLVARDGSDMTLSALLEAAAPVFRLNQAATAEILARVLGAVGQWRSKAKLAGLPPAEIDMMAAAFDSPRQRELQTFVAGGR